MRPSAAFIDRSPQVPLPAGYRPAAPVGPHPVPVTLTRPPRSILIAIVGAMVAVSVLASIGWRLSGGSLYTIATPSMCPDLCVGTLVLDQPLQGPVHVGEVVTFHPPGTATVYTHRVVQVLANGSFKTAGDALGKVDPWTVPVDNVIGRVVYNVRGLGWLWRSLPWMAAALACILIIRRSIAEQIRKQYDLLFTTLLVVVPILVMRPLLRMSIITWHVRHGGAVVMRVVNDGLLPTQVRSTGGQTVSHLAPGQIVTITANPAPGGVVSVRQLVSFSWWQWALLAAVVLAPMVGLAARHLWLRIHPPRLRLAPITAPMPTPLGPPPVPPRLRVPGPPAGPAAAVPGRPPPVHPLR